MARECSPLFVNRQLTVNKGCATTRYTCVMELKDRIRYARTTQELSLDEVGRRCGWADAKQRIANYESGLRTPRLPDIQKLASALGCPPEWLAFGVESGTALSAEERSLLAVWRRSDAEVRAVLLRLLKDQGHPEDPESDVGFTADLFLADDPRYKAFEERLRRHGAQLRRSKTRRRVS